MVDEDELRTLLEAGTPMVEGELGRLFITNTWLPEDPNATIELDVQGFLGIKTIKARGLKKQSLY